MKAWIDGASRGNPGEAAIGGYVLSESGEKLLEFGHRIGIATNNIAEYRALEYMLRWVEQYIEGRDAVSGLVVHSDSELMVPPCGRPWYVRNMLSADWLLSAVGMRLGWYELAFPVGPTTDVSGEPPSWARTDPGR